MQTAWKGWWLIHIHISCSLYNCCFMRVFFCCSVKYERNWMYETCWRECSVVTVLPIIICQLKIGQNIQNYSSHSNCNLTSMRIYYGIKVTTLYSNAKYYLCSGDLIYGSCETAWSTSSLWCWSSLNLNTARLQGFVFILCFILLQQIIRGLKNASFSVWMSI